MLWHGCLCQSRIEETEVSDYETMRLIDADFIISILDEAEQEYPEHKPIYEMFRDVINAVPTAAEIVSQEDTEE